MYKIMLADDEGIVIDSLTYIIRQNFGDRCEIVSAKTGRSVIELAESFRPDIAFMDIQMPGINGIEAMKEIRKNNANLIFIVMSAYDKFDYAKEAINLGVLDYLNKPVNQRKIVAVLQRAMELIDARREKRSRDLEIREKLEIVVPMIEQGFVMAGLLQEGETSGIENYRQLLGMTEENLFTLVLEFGEEQEGGTHDESRRHGRAPAEAVREKLRDDPGFLPLLYRAADDEPAGGMRPYGNGTGGLRQPGAGRGKMPPAAEETIGGHGA